MLLAIDIGNTNITLGLWDSHEWRRQWRLRTVHDMTVDEYGVYLKALLREANADTAVDAVIMSSVVPPLNLTFAEVCRDYLDIDAIQVTSETKTGIVINTENPAEVGADRIVNAAAAYRLCQGPAVVVDMGTATTFDAIADKGVLVGVAIAPGLGLAAEALASRAAQLGRVALEAPPKAIGRNTVQAMQSGLVYGYVALIEGMVQRFKNELGVANIQVVGTGGMISIITPHTGVVDHVHPWLTLDGLLAIYKLNENDAAGTPF
jgi:type III pantothenate kinase